jgi:hypothetical protein
MLELRGRRPRGWLLMFKSKAQIRRNPQGPGTLGEAHQTPSVQPLLPMSTQPVAVPVRQVMSLDLIVCVSGKGLYSNNFGIV